ncbi:MAG TPA: penicillin-binding transpeptidase domain-containing protein, partial [Arthrobacter sp.]|nr:penicillin-binding transpeptidase domain-containing protein [Arthrobacter sp.]
MAKNTGRARKAKAPSATRRLRLGLGVMLTLLLVVGGKLFLVQGLDVGGMAEAALQNRLTPIELPAERGSILDANGTVLASSVIRYNVVVDQRVNTKTESFRRFDEDNEELVKVSRDQGISELAPLLGMDTATVKQALTGDQPYYIVAKDLKPDVEDRISKLQIPGIVTVGTSKRVYPNGSVAGGIVGFLQDGGTGLAGLEQTQDEILKGTPGKRLFEIGADGLRIPVGVDQLTPAVNGKDIKLTLNADLQYFAQQAIQSQRDKLSAEWGVVIVQDIKTGDIIAMADTNSPDPNDPGKVDAKDRGVRAVTAAYEPGSVQKMIVAAALIEEGKSSPLDKFTIPSSYTVDGQTFNDAFPHGTEERTLAGILGWSMNTGTVMAGQRLSKEQRYDWLKKFGIGEAPDV